MKANQTLLTLGLLAVLQAVAVGEQSTNAVASANISSTSGTSKTQVQIQKTQVQPTYPAIQYTLENKTKAAKDQGKILRYQGLSSLPWATIATRQSDAFMLQDAKEHEANFCLFSIGHKPGKETGKSQ